MGKSPPFWVGLAGDGDGNAGASFDHTRTVLHHGMPGFANRGAPEIKKVICRTRKPVWYGAILGHDG